MKTNQWPLLLWSLFAASTASATIERAIEVAQPIVTESGITISDVTFVRYLGAVSWGEVVGYTCKESFVVNEAGAPENRNAASLVGIAADAYTYHIQNQALFGDTMKVFIDLTDMDLSKVRWRNTRLIEATLECVLINATRCTSAWEKKSGKFVTAKHLTVEFRGSSDPAHSTRTYLLQDLLQSVPRKRHFE